MNVSPVMEQDLNRVTEGIADGAAGKFLDSLDLEGLERS